MKDLVWYASYGSNMLKNRFLCYICGGTPEGAGKDYLGCSDKTEPIENKPIILPYSLYFSKQSSIWENKGVAFIKSLRDENIRTLGRMYLISKDQFIDLVHQENALDPRNTFIDIDFAYLILNGETKIPAHWYSRIIYIGEENGHPIFTFTSACDDSEITLQPPGEKYLRTIIKGIKETYNITNEEIMQYLIALPGIKGLISKQDIYTIVKSI
jgi:hypothetical protein